jgi:hypothetical protein
VADEPGLGSARGGEPWLGIVGRVDTRPGSKTEKEDDARARLSSVAGTRGPFLVKEDANKFSQTCERISICKLVLDLPKFTCIYIIDVSKYI